MLRINENHSELNTTLALAGVLDAGGVSELVRVLDSHRPKARELTLDLSQLRYADRNGVGFLLSAAQGGVQLTSVPPYIRTWLRHEGCCC